MKNETKDRHDKTERDFTHLKDWRVVSPFPPQEVSPNDKTCRKRAKADGTMIILQISLACTDHLSRKKNMVHQKHESLQHIDRKGAYQESLVLEQQVIHSEKTILT